MITVKEIKRGKYCFRADSGEKFVLYASEQRHLPAELDASLRKFLKTKKLDRIEEYKSGEFELPIDMTAEMMDFVEMKLLKPRWIKRCGKLLTTRDYTSKELSDKMTEEMIPEKVIDEVLETLSGYHYLDDFRFAKNYINYKKGIKSKRAMMLFLQKKGISEDVIERAMIEEYASDAFIEEEESPEEEAISAYLRKKRIQPKELDYESKQKLKSLLYRKGFSLRNIQKMIDISIDE